MKSWTKSTKLFSNFTNSVRRANISYFEYFKINPLKYKIYKNYIKNEGIFQTINSL